MTVKVIDQALVTVSGVVINGPQAPIQVAAKCGAGLSLAAAKSMLVLEYIDPDTWDSLGAAAKGIAIQVAQAQATDALTIDGTAFAFVASGATGNQVNIGASATASATALAAAINADEELPVSAQAEGTTVYLTAKDKGTDGNAITLATNAPSRLSVSGATLSGGVAGDIGAN